MSGMGFDGGDGYRCRFGRLGPSRWFVDRQNEVVADLINMDTLRCTSPNASMAMSYGVLYEEFDAVARGHMRYSDLRGDAILQGGNLSLIDGAGAPTGGIFFQLAMPLQSFEVRMNLSIHHGGYVELVYAKLPHSDSSKPCTPRCHYDPFCEPHWECEPLAMPPTQGLRVRFDASTPPHAVEVIFNRTTLWRQSVQAPFTNVLQPAFAFFTVVDGLLNVQHAGHTLVANLRLPRWVEGGFDPAWRLGLVAAAVAPSPGAPLAGSVVVDDFDIRDGNSGGLTRKQEVEFSVAVNAQQFSRDSMRFLYYPPPKLSTIQPSSGSSYGGTIVTLRGANFDTVGTHFLCSFAVGPVSMALNGHQWSSRADVVDATRYSDGEMRCRSPPADFLDELPRKPNISWWETPPSAPPSSPPAMPPPPPPQQPPLPPPPPPPGIPLRPNRTQLSESGSPLNATAYAIETNGSSPSLPPSVRGPPHSTPSGSPSAKPDGDLASSEVAAGSGDADVGNDFGSGSGEIGSGSGEFGFVDEPEPITAAFATVAVALNGRQFASSGTPFVYFGTPVISHFSPSCGPAAGGAMVRVAGHHLRNGTAYRCRFGSAAGLTVNATLHEYSGDILCVAPPRLPVGRAPLEISLNAQDFTVDGAPFATYPTPWFTAIVPRSGPILGGTHIRTMHGSGPGCDHRCAFGNTSELQVYGGGDVYGAGRATLCVTPPLASIQPHHPGDSTSCFIRVSLNAQQFTTRPLPFDWFVPTVSYLIPSSGPIGNATQVVVRGGHFSPRAEVYLCAFGHSVVSATRRNDTAIVCTATPDPLRNATALSVEVSLNGREYSKNKVTFTYASEPVIDTISPSLGPATGGTVIVLTGLSFEVANGQMRCRFDAGAHTKYVDVLQYGAADGLYLADNVSDPSGPLPSILPPNVTLRMLKNGTNASKVALLTAANTSARALNVSLLSVQGVLNATVLNATSARLNMTGNASDVNATLTSLVASEVPPPPGAPPLLPPPTSPTPRAPPNPRPPIPNVTTVNNQSLVLACIAPSLSELGAYATLKTAFDDAADGAPDGTRLRGGARVENGHLKLSGNPRNESHSAAFGAHLFTPSGSLLLALAAGLPAHRTFTANFTLLLGGEADSGVCLSYGPLPISARSAGLLHERTTGRRSCRSSKDAPGLTVLIHVAPIGCRDESLSSRRLGLRCRGTGMTARVHGRIVVAESVGPDLATPTWASASVSVTEVLGLGIRLIVVYAGRELVRDLPAHVWKPQPLWTFALSAWPAHPATFAHLAGAAASMIASDEATVRDAITCIDNFELRSSAVVLHAPAGLRVVLNPDTALQPEGVFMSNIARFEYYVPPTIHTLVPSTGPAFGLPLVSIEAHWLATFAAHLFAIETRCRFGDVAADAATYMYAGTEPSASLGTANTQAMPFARFACRAPVETSSRIRYLDDNGTQTRHDKHAVYRHVAISLNGQQYSGGVTLGLAPQFVFHSRVVINSVAPAFGPDFGGTLVRIRGDQIRFGMRNEYRCRFHGTSVPASYDTSRHVVQCRTPPQPGISFNTSRLDNVRVVEAIALFNEGRGVYEYIHEYANETIGNESVTLTVRRRVVTKRTEWSHCELVNTTDPLSRIDRWMRRHIRSLNSSHEIRCMLPSDGAFAAYVAVHVSLNDQVYTLMSNAVSRFAYTATAHAEYLEPPTGPALGGLLVAVRGTNFSHGVPYACRFGVALVTASRVHSSEIVCQSPAAHRTGAAESLSLDIDDPWLLTHGASLSVATYELMPLTLAVEIAEYIPPAIMVLSTFRIVEEPRPLTTAGVPFEGVLRIELLDQRGALIPTGEHLVSVALKLGENATMRSDTDLLVSPQPSRAWCGASGEWCPNTVAASSEGVVSFYEMRLDTIGDGVYFEVSVVDLPGIAVLTNRTYTVTLGPPARLNFIRTPDDGNLLDVHFETQPWVEVTDLGGNRVGEGMHTISLSLAQGAGRLRGPKVRYTRNGVAIFNRLRIGTPGYDKVLMASAPGLASGMSAPFGVVPHGIPYAMKFISSPTIPVMSGAYFPNEHAVIVELLDVYGARIAVPPMVALAPYFGSGSRLSLGDVCDAPCRANVYTVVLRVESLDNDGNPHLRGDSSTEFTMAGNAVAAVDGLVDFSGLKLTLGVRGMASRVRLHAELIAEREISRHDENGTLITHVESYQALIRDMTTPFAVMRPTDPVSMRLCDSPRSIEDHNAGICVPYAPGPVVQACSSIEFPCSGFAGPVVVFYNINGTEVVIQPYNARGEADPTGDLPMAPALVRITICTESGDELNEPRLTGMLTHNSRLQRSPRPAFLARQVVDMGRLGVPLFEIQAGGTYRVAVTSLGLQTALTLGTLTVVGTQIASMAIDALPTVPQAYGERIEGPASPTSSGRLLSVALYDTFGNANSSTGVEIKLEVSGQARFLHLGWLTTELSSTTVDGVADFSEVTIAPPPSFVDVETVVQSIHVDGIGPDQAGWGIDPSRVVFDYEYAVVELKGIGDPGELVLMQTDEFDRTLCGQANDAVYQAGDYAHPAGSNQPLQRMKYLFHLKITLPDDDWAAPGLLGPVANFTILPPIMISNAQVRQRDRENWPLPSPLEIGAYGLCYKREGSPAWKAQLGNRARFVVGPVEMRRVVSVSPEVIFPFIDTEIRLTFGPDPTHVDNAALPMGMSIHVTPGVASATASASNRQAKSSGAIASEVLRAGRLAVLGAPGDLVAIRDEVTIVEINCSFVRPDEVQRVTANNSIHSGPLTLGTNKYHLCMAKADVLDWVPPGGPGAPWPWNFSQQLIVRLSVINVLNAGGGHQVGVFTAQDLALRATIRHVQGIPPATRSGAITMMPPRLPVMLELIGPRAGSIEVRGVSFVQQPVVRVIGVDGRLYPDVTGSIVIGAFGACAPTLEGQDTAELVGGIATFTEARLDTVACLGEDVGIRAAVAEDLGGTVVSLGLATVSTDLFRIKHGAPHRVVFATEFNVIDDVVAISRSDGSQCMQTFALGEAAISAVVRDAQGSPVPDYNLPIDLRLCDAPLTPDGLPRCPAAHAALLGSVQVMAVAGHALFNNFTVTNISSGFTLALYTPLLLVDYSQPFAACDAGVPQELHFVRAPPHNAIAALPFSSQPILLVRDGFGRPVRRKGLQMPVSIRAVRPSVGPDSAITKYVDSYDDWSAKAQLSGQTRVLTTYSDPLNLDEWNTTINHGQHAVYFGLALGTAGLWRLHVSSPALSQPALSDIIEVAPGLAVSLRFDVPQTPLRTYIDTPLSPEPTLRLLDASGNNITHTNASARVSLSLVREVGLNDGRIEGNASTLAEYGAATFANVRFNEAGTLKRLTASGFLISPEGDELPANVLANDTSSLIRIFPGPAWKLEIKQQPATVYAVSPEPPPTASLNAGTAAAAAEEGFDGVEIGSLRDRIVVRVALLDFFGNEVCSSLMADDECRFRGRAGAQVAALADEPLAIALTLLHADTVNYTTSPLASATRTVANRVVFNDGFLGAKFDKLRIYRPAADFAFNVSLSYLPVDVTEDGVPIRSSQMHYPLQSSRFDALERGTPVGMSVDPPNLPMYISDERWTNPPVVLILDVNGELCDRFMGQLRMTISGGDASFFLPGWDVDGALVDVINGTARFAEVRVTRKDGTPIRRGVRFVAEELIGHTRLVSSITGAAFDVFDTGINQRLAFQLYTHPLTFLPRALRPLTLAFASLRKQPLIRVLDANGSLVTGEMQPAPVQIAIELAETTLSPPPLYGSALTDSHHGIARFDDLSIGGAVRGARLRATAPGLIDAVSDPFDVVVPDEPARLTVLGAPVDDVVVLSGVPLTRHNLSAEIVDAFGQRVNHSPTTLVHMCLRALGHVGACTVGAPNLLASATAFASFPGGRANFGRITIYREVCTLIGAADCRGLFFEASAVGLEPGRTQPMTEALPPGLAAQLAFLPPLRRPAAGEEVCRTARAHRLAVTLPEGEVLLGDGPAVSIRDARDQLVPTHDSHVTLTLKMLELEWPANETGANGSALLPPLTPPSVPPPFMPPRAPPPNTTNATDAGAAGNMTNVTSIVLEERLYYGWPSDPGPLVALLGNTTAELSQGVATFSGLSIAFRREHLGVPGPRRGVFVLVARSNGVHWGTSANISVLKQDAPYALKFAAPPSEYVRLGHAIRRPPTLQVVGLGGEHVPAGVEVWLVAVAPLGSGHSAPVSTSKGALAYSASRAQSLPTPSELNMLPASTLGGYVGARTDESGNLTLHGLNFSVGGNFELYAYTEDLMPALSRSIAVIRPPAILPCPEETCQWASTASAGVGSRLPDVSDITLLASLTADGEVGMPDWPDSLNHVSIGQPHTAVGPADMEGCGLSNRGLVWEPYGGRDGRWLLLGFRTPVFATRVAVYESHAYGSVQQLLLLDEDNGYHAILDQEQGDRDLADCLRSPLLVSFPPTQRRIVALWLLVGVGAVESTHDSRSRRSNHPSAAHIDEARLAQIDAAQLFSTPPPTGSGGPLLRAFIYARGSARFERGAVRLTSDRAGQSGGLILHMPSAFALRARNDGNGLATNRTNYTRVGFDLHIRAGEGARRVSSLAAEDLGNRRGTHTTTNAFGATFADPRDDGGRLVPGGFSFCYGELPNAGSVGEPGVGVGLCLSFRCSADMRTAHVEARYQNTAVLHARQESTSPNSAASPVCDGATAVGGGTTHGGRSFEPPQCEHAPTSPPTPLTASVPMVRGQWHSAEVEISSSGLSVWFDGSYLFERTPLPKWNPREEWGFSFGARAGYAMTADGGGFVVGPMTHNSIANVNVERGAAVESSTVAVHVSANGQQFVRAGVYGYHAHPHVLHLTPTVGFAAGGTDLTLRGIALGGADSYTCRFMMGLDPSIQTRGHFDPAVEGVRCPAPTRSEYDQLTLPWDPEHKALYVPNSAHSPTLNLTLRMWRKGLEYLPRSRSTFTLIPAPDIRGAKPASGPVFGGSTVHVRGRDLGGGWRYSCHFADTSTAEEAAGVGDDAAPLPQPAGPPGRIVRLERNTPASHASRIAGGSVVCISPQSPVLIRSHLHSGYDTYRRSKAWLSVSLNAADYDKGVATPFEFYDPPSNLSLSVMNGPVLGGMALVVSGGNLTGGTDRRCRFVPIVFGVPSLESRRTAWGMRREVAASVFGGPKQQLKCVTPRLPERVAQVTVEVALNGQQYTMEGLRFVLLPRVGDSSLSVPPEGGWGFSFGALAFVPVTDEPDEGRVVKVPRGGDERALAVGARDGAAAASGAGTTRDIGGEG